MGVVLAWLFGEGILVYRWVWKAKAPPPPGAIALSSALFLGCAMLAQHQPARVAANAFAWSVDVAVLLKLLDGNVPAPDSSGWPPGYIPCGQLLGKAGAGVASPPNCSGGGNSSQQAPASLKQAASSAQQGANAGTQVNPFGGVSQR